MQHNREIKFNIEQAQKEMLWVNSTKGNTLFWNKPTQNGIFCFDFLLDKVENLWL